MPTMNVLVDGTVPIAADFNGNFTALNAAIGTGTSIVAYAAGDILYASAINTLSRLAKGSVGSVLTMGATVPAWGSPLGGSALAGLTLTNDVTTPLTTLDVAQGLCTSDDALYASRVPMTLTAMTGTVSGTWLVGTAQPKLDAGTVANTTTYHVFVIERLDTSLTDILFSTSATAPVLPSSYSKKRRIGAFRTSATAQIIPFHQYGDEFYWDTVPALDVNATNPTTTAVTRTLTVPLGVPVLAFVNLLLIGSASNEESGVYLSSLDVTDQAASSTAAPLATIAGSLWSNPYGHGGSARVWTNASGQIRSRCLTSSASIIFRLATIGWLDRRGQDA